MDSPKRVCYYLWDINIVPFRWCPCQSISGMLMKGRKVRNDCLWYQTGLTFLLFQFVILTSVHVVLRIHTIVKNAHWGTIWLEAVAWGHMDVSMTLNIVWRVGVKSMIIRNVEWIRVWMVTTVIMGYAPKVYIHYSVASRETRCGLVTPYGSRDLGQHWFR